LVEQVGGGHYPDDAPILDDQQAADRSPPHQIGGLPERGGRTGAYGIGGHQITNEALVSRRRSSCATQVALGHDANQASVLHHDKMTDAVLAHRGPSDARGVISPNGDHFNAHDISESHDRTSCKWRAGPVNYRLNSCLRLGNRRRLRRTAIVGPKKSRRAGPISP
jgi:hypothetical protein